MALSATSFLTGCTIGGPSIDQYVDGNNLTFGVGEVKSVYATFNLQRDSGSVTFVTGEDDTIKVTGTHNKDEEYNFRYVVENKKLYIREAGIETGEQKPSTYRQDIVVTLPKQKSMERIEFDSAAASVKVLGVNANNIRTESLGGGTTIENCVAKIVYAKAWTSSITMKNNVVSESLSTWTTYATSNIWHGASLPNTTDCFSKYGKATVNLLSGTTNWAAYTGGDELQTDFPVEFSTYEEGDVVKNKYTMGDGSKKISFSLLKEKPVINSYDTLPE